MIYPLDERNTKKLKKTKTKPADFFVNTCISVKLFQKKPVDQMSAKLIGLKNSAVVCFSAHNDLSMNSDHKSS